MRGRLMALLRAVGALCVLVGACVYCLLIEKRRDTLIWGVTPLINYKYWSAAMREGGYKSLTLVTHHYPAHRREDYDIYLDDLVPGWIKSPYWRSVAGKCAGLIYMIRNASVVHLPFTGGLLGDTLLWRIEPLLFQQAGIKTLLVPYGGDAHIYAEYEPAVRNALLMSYPLYGRMEAHIRKRLSFWIKRADCVMCGFMLAGMSRWDVPVPNMLTLELAQWQAKSSYSSNDGRNGPVSVVHAPNHRGIKGTEFVIGAVELLRAEGLQIELLLLEGIANEEVKQRMKHSDILAEQLILPGYGLNGIEGLACGLPVLSNLDSEWHTRVFRRYSFLDECPVLSTTPETIAEHLRILVTSPELRETLGRAGRAYAEKYYSYAAAQYLFGSIYRRLLKGEPIDLINLFHPLKPPAEGARPKVVHPLIENKLPVQHPARAFGANRNSP